MSLQPTPPTGPIAIIPLVGNRQSDDSNWLGALFSRMITAHLSGVGVAVLDYNAVVQQIVSDKHSLPLKEDQLQALRVRLKLRALVRGAYVFDEESKMLGVRLVVDAPDIPPAPIEVSTPLAGWARFVDRLVPALIEQLSIPIDESLRERLRNIPRPASFEALRQLAQAHASWARGQRELALAAIVSALALDPDFEDAATLEVAIAREANDPATAREAFRRWSAIAIKSNRPLVGADRLTMLGHWLADRGEWVEARRAYEDARNVYQREHNEIGTARALNNVASLDLQGGKTQAALATYRRSLRLFETDPATLGDAAITLLNLSQAHKALGQHEEALLAVERAGTMARQLKDNSLWAHCFARRGAIRDDMGEWGKASADYAQAASLFDVLGDEVDLAAVRCHQAIILRQQGSYEQAERMMLEALEIIQTEAPLYDRAVLWLNLADLYFAMRLYDRAWTYAEQALRTFEQLKSDLAGQARDLLDVLEEIPDEPAPTAPGSPPPESPPPPDREGLYNQGSLYDNESTYDDNGE
jgi:tetratricopeptide (TPR) repeat protein